MASRLHGSQNLFAPISIACSRDVNFHGDGADDIAFSSARYAGAFRRSEAPPSPVRRWSVHFAARGRLHATDTLPGTHRGGRRRT